VFYSRSHFGSNFRSCVGSVAGDGEHDGEHIISGVSTCAVGDGEARSSGWVDQRGSVGDGF
jgi:hypothetical protein